MKSNPLPALEELQSLFEYNPDSGELFWRVRTSNRIYPGKVAGWSGQRGYRSVTLGKRKFKVHRIAFYMGSGIEPTGEIDHINGVKSDNRLCNLRDATRSQNRANTRAFKNNKLGLKRVSKHKGKYRAQIGFHGRKIYIGLFESPEEAHAAYVEKARKLFGGFAHA